MKKWINFTIFLAFLFLLRKGLFPLLIGLIIACTLDPYVDWLTRKTKSNRSISILIAYLTLCLAITLLIFGFTSILSGNLQSESILRGIQVLENYYYAHQDILTGKLSDNLTLTNMTDFLQNLGSNMFKVLVGFIMGAYLLKDKDFFLRLGSMGLYLFLDQKTHGIFREICFEISEVISSFLRGVFIESVIVAVLSSCALALLQVKSAIFIGCFAGISNIIPYFGPVIGIIPAVIIAFTHGGIIKAAAAAGALFLIQQIECNLIYPRIIGKSTGLHPLFVLVAVSVAGYYGGLLSMVLAVPLAGILKIIVCKWAYAQ